MVVKDSVGVGQPNLLLISTINFLSFLDINLLIPMIALFAATLGTGPGAIGILIGLYSVTNTPMNIISGRLIDRTSYKLPLLIGLAGSSVSMFAYSFVRLPVHLALVRAVHGIFGGMKSPAMMSAFTMKTGDSRRGRVMGFYGMSIALANLAGFALSGIIVSRLGYRALFLLGMVALGVGAAITLRLPRAERLKVATENISPGEVYARVKQLLGRKGLLVSFIAIFAQYFTFGGIVTLLPLHLKNLGMEAFHVGMLLTVYTVVFIALQLPSGALSDRLGRFKMVDTGLFLGIVALVILPGLTSFAAFALIMALYGAAFGLIFPSVSALIADHARPEERGLASGIFHALLTAGVAIGAPVMGGIGSALGIATGLALNPIILVLVLGISLLLPGKGAVKHPGS